MSQPKEKFMIIDGNALLHRAWHALPQTMRSPDGRITNAAYGFASIFLKAIKDIKPTHIAVCFDAQGPTFRDKMYKEYKAHRKKKPQDLYDQIYIIQELLNAFDVKFYQVTGVEADDVIGTLVSKSKIKDQRSKNIIVTGDMDALQLVDKNTEVYTLRRGVSDTAVYGIKEVIKKYNGLKPEQLIDYKALRGDPSDNIPGAKGVGEKGAIELIKKFGTIEALLEKLKQQGVEKLSEKSKIRESVLQKVWDSRKNVKLSKKLGAIKLNVNIKIKEKEISFGNFNPEVAAKTLQQYAFRTLVAKVADIAEIYGMARKHAAPSGASYIFADSDNKILKLFKNLKKLKIFAVDTETDSLDVISAKLVGLSFCWNDKNAFYIDYKSLKPKLRKELASILANQQIKKIGHNIKYDWHILQNTGINLNGIYFDTMVSAYVLNPGGRQYSLNALAYEYFGASMQKIEELIGHSIGSGHESQQQLLGMAQVDPKKVAYYSAEDAYYTWKLYQNLEGELVKKNLQKVFYNIEMPCVEILGQMERAGIGLNTGVLRALDKKVSAKIKILEKTIYQLAGKPFNIASHLQLKEVLFEKLKISTKGLRKTKTGVSTAAPELEKMRGVHPIIDYIFEYRELAKLKSTYIDALPKLIHKTDKRIHTSFNQTITATGRLSSSNPNMQNIPIRTSLGREIRRSFVAGRGNQLLSLDYSQIDLRVAAHLSSDKNMIEVFKNDKDIHTSTAARIFDKNIKDVTKEERASAKTVNFGVLYGQGPHALAQQTGMSFAEAQAFIDRYKSIYPQVFEFLEKVIDKTREKGYAPTLYGRRRYLPEINSGTAQVRAAAERMAINMPVQGTSADIIKIAMIRIAPRLGNNIKMLLQVHDELVFDVKKDKVKKWASIIKKEMESAASLKVPLKVDAKAGSNWKEMEEV